MQVHFTDHPNLVPDFEPRSGILADPYPFFTVDLSVLFESFDETPGVVWHTMHDELWVDGRIGGEDAFIIFRRNPFSDVGPASQVLEGNMLREKRNEE